MATWNSESWEKEKIQLFWQLAGGQSFYYKNIPAEQLGLGNSNSVGATARKLVEPGYLLRIARGQYNFTEKARSIIRSFQPTPVPKIEPRKRDVAMPLTLSPAEFRAFQSLNNCKPCDTGPEKHQKDRINEESIDTSALDDEEREDFFKKMLRLGIFLEIGPGTKGRVIHFNLEKYLELCDKVQIIFPVENKLASLRLELNNKLHQAETLESERVRFQTESVNASNEANRLERQLEEITVQLREAEKMRNKKIEDYEQVIQAISASGGEIEISRLQRKIAALEALADMDEVERAEFISDLCPKIS